MKLRNLREGSNDDLHQPETDKDVRPLVLIGCTFASFSMALGGNHSPHILYKMPIRISRRDLTSVII